MLTDNKYINIHADAMAEFNTIQSAVRGDRKQCLEDRRFCSIPGAQWEGNVGEQFENKPRFEVNKVHLAIIRIFSEYRNNRITVDFVAKDGNQNDQLADTCDGLYRADEQDSGAEEAYDNAFEEAVSGGFGAWRLRADYEDEEDEEDERQRIRIEPIFDADSSVFFDLNAKRQDKADAYSCYVITSMSPAAYEDEYDDDPASWPKDIESTEFNWSTPDAVYVAEYYKVESVGYKVHVYRTVDGEEQRYTDEDFENDEELESTLAAIGTRKIREKKIKKKKVRKLIMSGGGVLEDCGYIAGSNIPIVPVYGKRWFIDNVERCMGHVRLAKDPQRLKNMQVSRLAEISAASITEKPIFINEQIAPYWNEWSEDNIKNYAALRCDPAYDDQGNVIATGPVGQTKSPEIPPAMAALLQLTEQDILDILGNQQQGDKVVSNISGKAVELVHQRLDMQTFIYVSNMAKAIRRSGEIWLGMAKDVYVEEGRTMKVIGRQDEASTIELLKPLMNEDGVGIKENDLSNAKFDIAVDVGPSSSSRKAAIVRDLHTQIAITDDPETKAVLSAMAAMNLEGEGIQDIRDYFRRKLVIMGVVKPTKEEQAELDAAGRQQDPNAEYLQAAAEQARAEAAQANANVINKIADAEQKQAKTAEILAGIDQVEVENALKVLQMISQNQQTVTTNQDK